jgi:hypothetical protein
MINALATIPFKYRRLEIYNRLNVPLTADPFFGMKDDFSERLSN